MEIIIYDRRRISILPINNWRSMSTTSKSAPNNRRTQMTDAGGNITTYTWTDDNQLAAVTLPNSGGTVTNTYDGDGLRFSRADSSGTNSYLWSGQVLEAQLGNGNTVSTWYTQGMGDGNQGMGQFGDVISTRDAVAETSSLQLYDASGNVSQTTDSGAGITTTLAYDTFGVVTDNSGPANPTVAWQGKQGYQCEQPLGLQYVRQRWYDPATRQFISPDPLGFAGGDVNLFRYAGNNPVNRSDPGGKQNWPQGIAVSDDTLTALMLGEVATQLQANSLHADALASGYMNELQGVDRDILHTLEQSSASLAPFNPRHPAIGQAVRAALAAFGPSMQQVLHRVQQSYVPLTTAQLHEDYLWAHRHEAQIPTLAARLQRDLLAVQTAERFLRLQMHAEGPHRKLPSDLPYLNATEALLKATIGFTGRRWGVYQSRQNAFQGGYFRSEESDIQSLITAMRMIPGGQSAWDILHHHPGYAAGWGLLDVASSGTDDIITHSTALLRNSRIDEHIATAGTWVRRWFYDPREFSVISREYWADRGPAAGRSLHHWLFPQRWKWVPVGFRNAGVNLLELPEFRGLAHPRLSLNTFMGFARRWNDAAEVSRAIRWEWGIRIAIPASPIIGAAIGYGAGELIKTKYQLGQQK